MSAPENTEFNPFDGDEVLAANVDTLIDWGIGDGEWNPLTEDGAPMKGMVVLGQRVGVLTDDEPWSDEEAGPKPVRAFVKAAGGELVYVIVESASEPTSGNGRRAEIIKITVDAPVPNDTDLYVALLESMDGEVEPDQPVRVADEDAPTRTHWRTLFWLEEEDATDEEVEAAQKQLADQAAEHGRVFTPADIKWRKP